MTDEDLRKVAIEIAQYLYNDDKAYNSILWWCNKPKERKAEELEIILKFLLEKFCIVEKKKVRSFYKVFKSNTFLEEPTKSFSEGNMNAIEEIFEKELFDDTEK